MKRPSKTKKLKPAGKPKLDPNYKPAPITPEQKAEIAEDEKYLDAQDKAEEEWDIKDHLDDPIGNGGVLGDIFNEDGTSKF